MLLRDKRQMAVSTVEIQCFATADSYASAASRAGDQALALLFDRLAAERQQLAAELAAHIRALDDLPQQPDPDREAMEQVLSGIKAFLSGDTHATLVAERLRAEEELAAAAREALQCDLPPETQAILHRIIAHGESARSEIIAKAGS